MASTLRNCPICQHHDVALTHANTMAPIGGLDMSYTVSRCLHCGLFFANSLPALDTYSAYYRSVSKYDIATRISETEEARIRAAVEICSSIVPRNALIADLGCGYGALLSRLKAAGYTNLYGLDPAPNSAARARELFGLDCVAQGTLSDACRMRQVAEADLVCITAVLEHLPELRPDLERILNALKPGCRVLVEVPALECFDGASGEPFGEFSLEHIQFFSQNSLDNLFSSLGAESIAARFLDIPSVRSGSLFSIYELTGRISTDFSPSEDDAGRMATYIASSRARQDAVLARIPAGPLVIYGAGSHTARLLPKIRSRHEIVAVIDGNPNLHNKTIADHVVQPPSALESLHGLPILVSSFHAQKAIVTSLRAQYPNPLIQLYE